MFKNDLFRPPLTPGRLKTVFASYLDKGSLEKGGDKFLIYVLQLLLREELDPYYNSTALSAPQLTSQLPGVPS